MRSGFGSPVIDAASRLLVPFMWLFAAYVLVHGHDSPGGGFQGGVSASLAVFVTWLTAQALPTWGVIPGLSVDAETVFMGPTWVVSIVVGGALVGILASHLATGRFLRTGDAS